MADAASRLIPVGEIIDVLATILILTIVLANAGALGTMVTSFGTTFDNTLKIAGGRLK